jgi:hypothetical protein
MKKQEAVRNSRCLLLFACCLCLCNCSNSSHTGLNNSATASTAIAKASPSPDLKLSTTQPTLAEAQGAVTRIYQRAVSVDGSNPNPFVVGDFNGDSSEDLAIAVKPNAEMLVEINSEFANWITEDPKTVVLFDSNKSVQPLPSSERAKIGRSDTLLAIIHGYQQTGWRNPEAKQTYLLKNGDGESMQALPLKSFPPALRVMRQGFKSRADIITINNKGVSAFIYWTNGKYAWHQY